jgi:hypothetical protein
MRAGVHNYKKEPRNKNFPIIEHGAFWRPAAGGTEEENEKESLGASRSGIPMDGLADLCGLPGYWRS